MMHSRAIPRWMVVSLVLLAVWVPAQAGAQDMQFSSQESGEAPAPPQQGPPSEALANALRLYQQQRYNEAAVQLQRVAKGKTGDAGGNVQKGQFFLGKALYHLELYQSALSIFDEISKQGQQHLFYGQTLQWVAQLATQLPQPAGMVEVVGRYGSGALQQFNRSGTRDIYNRLLFLMGRSKYQKGEFKRAVDLFGQVSKTSDRYVKAKFLQGVSYIRMRQASPAIDSFRAIIKGLDAGNVGAKEPQRMRDLAWLSLGRVYYTAANQSKGGKRQVDGRLLGQAVEAWNQVDQSSEYWLDAVFESSWAFFLADEYARALGNIHTLFSPYFTGTYYPEGYVLKAVTFFVNCQIENASAMVGKFHDNFDPVKKELQNVLSKFKDNTEFFKFLKRVRQGNAELSPKIRGIVQSALSDRSVLRHLEYVELLDEQKKRLEQMPQAFRNSSLGVRIQQDIQFARSFAIDETGELVRGRYKRLISELRDLMTQMDTVDLEIATYKRGQLSQKAQKQMTAAAESGGGDVEVDREHQLWPFSGEYWRDELGFYRQQVTNKCGR